MVFDDLISEAEARAHLHALRAGSIDAPATLWLKLGTFLFENDLTDWQGLCAVECFRKALQLHDPTNPLALADAKLGLGAALIEAESGYRDPTLEEAIACLSHASDIYAEQDDIEGEIRARFYRAYARTELVGSKRYRGSELAINELNEICQAQLVKEDPPFAANVSLILGSAYLDRVEGEPRENNALAEAAFGAGLRLYDMEGNDQGRAQACLDLAVTFNERHRLGDVTAGEKAFDYAYQALEFSASDVPHELYTSILSNLATALAERGGQQDSTNLRKAEALLSEGIALSDVKQNIGGKVLRLVRAGLLLGLCQYQEADRLDDVSRDLDACEGHFDPVETTQWWLEWQELRALAAAVADDAPAMIACAEETLQKSQTILERTEPFAEKTHLLSQLSLTLDLGVLGHLKANGPVAGLLFVRQIYGRMLGFEAAPVSQLSTPVENWPVWPE